MTKYDPRLRRADGVFTGDDWTGVGDVGRVFGGEVLTRERYEQVEASYVKAVELFAVESGVATLAVRTPELPAGGVFAPEAASGMPFIPAHALYDGYEVPLEAGLALVRAMLRGEGVWGRLEAEERFYAHVGWDYYLYVGSRFPCIRSVDAARQMGLFVEEFASPYDLELETPASQRPADEKFWAEVERLAESTGGELPLLELWAGDAWRWHLVTPGDGVARVRSELRPRAHVTAFLGPPVEITDSSLAEIAEHADRLLDENSSVAGVMCLIENRAGERFGMTTSWTRMILRIGWTPPVPLIAAVCTRALRPTSLAPWRRCCRTRTASSDLRGHETQELPRRPSAPQR
ncbi:hypothetical protein AB0B45_41105 [Nonomuraea sp. NPDC049152]|uniref:hypothetical protein n=1 Tax=Nonomuraea sp. NPDC049152 TaxID=3154350 RepID=UPI0033D00CD8